MSDNDPFMALTVAILIIGAVLDLTLLPDCFIKQGTAYCAYAVLLSSPIMIGYLIYTGEAQAAVRRWWSS